MKSIAETLLVFCWQIHKHILLYYTSHKVFLLFYEQIDAMLGEDGTLREMLPEVDTRELILEMCQFTRVAKTGMELATTFGSSEYVFLCVHMKIFKTF